MIAAESAVRPLHQIGAIGLGTGIDRRLRQAGQRITFYEIDPAVARIAWNPDYFTYLTDCKADVRVVLGDARLSLGRAESERYDLLVLDAYSSDAIPIHLLTREAVQLYKTRLTPHGLLAVSTSPIAISTWSRWWAGWLRTQRWFAEYGEKATMRSASKTSRKASRRPTG